MVEIPVEIIFAYIASVTIIIMMLILLLMQVSKDETKRKLEDIQLTIMLAKQHIENSKRGLVKDDS